MSPTLLILSILCWFALLRLSDVKRDNWPALLFTGYVCYFLGYVYFLRPILFMNFELSGALDVFLETIGRYGIICALAYVQGLFYRAYMKRDVQPLNKFLCLGNLWGAGFMLAVLFLYKASILSEGAFSILYREVFSLVGFCIFMTWLCQLGVYFAERKNVDLSFEDAVVTAEELMRPENIMARVSVAWILSLFVPFILYTMSNSHLVFVTSFVPFYVLKKSRRKYTDKLPGAYLVLMYFLSLCYIAFALIIGVFGVAFG